ncbi:MAG TPA: histidine kinase dimerization/phospho-acceptor domain-containing protein [Magnetospirillaceae bacterium]|nr:histidine kinase dimerization/phospho-acceptor domain-containing protein [Magnetospirillaceae bacterium]
MPAPGADALYDAVFDQNPVAMILTDGRGVPERWNPSFAAVFQALGETSPASLRESFFAWMDLGKGNRFSNYADELMAGKYRAVQTMSPIQAADGRMRWFRIRLSRILQGPDAADIRILATFEDDTWRQARVSRLLAAKAEAEKADRAKTMFLANTSHEIRTPIQTILGMTELLVETRLDKEQADYVRTVRFSADILLGLINDILDLSKIEAGRMGLERVEFDLRSVVAQAGDLLILDAHKKGLEVILETDVRLPRMLWGDPGRYRQIIVNLLTNSARQKLAGVIY